MYDIYWQDETDLPLGHRKAQYLPDIQEVVREAFGDKRTVSVSIVKEAE